MIPYKNLSGNSGVKAYESGRGYIKIEFAGGDVYLYDDEVPGKAFVDAMKKLAVKGKGLATFISKYVREDYAKKLR